MAAAVQQPPRHLDTMGSAAGSVELEEQSMESQEQGATKISSNLPPEIRRGFIRKVYTILSMQLMLTVAVAAPIAFVLGPTWVARNIWLYYLGIAGSLGILCGALCCCQDALRKFPTNYMLLFSFTLFESILVGCISAMYSPVAVIMAAATTIFVFLGLTAYACLTKTDFTGMGPYLMAALLVMIGFSFTLMLLSMFVPLPSWLHTSHAFVGVLLFCFYIVFDTQLIVGGRHKNEFSVDDYCFAALNLYLDIINLFLYILSIFGNR
eukprot:TRINITY_DN6113_c1_g1_i1.p1 TRINITY_DN6113_c1_g1~~TRINITY_DN6113_c1_g1_i1.p1  ORF type:complete len:266 (+),score=53.43 TRINITY_DN6113_c1_g1_i1:93-890(+)